VTAASQPSARGRPPRLQGDESHGGHEDAERQHRGDERDVVHVLESLVDGSVGLVGPAGDTRLPSSNNGTARDQPCDSFTVGAFSDRASQDVSTPDSFDPEGTSS
jgi:hypothetical protein